MHRNILDWNISIPKIAQFMARDHVMVEGWRKKVFSLLQIAIDRTVFAVFQTVIYNSFVKKELYIAI